MKTFVGLVLAAALVVTTGCQTQPVKMEPFAGDQLGIVMLHGKGGTPGKFGSVFIEAAREAGALVEAPEMPWARSRIYAKTYEDSLLEIDAAVQQLRAAGAKRVVVAGHSMGANAALGYATRHGGIDGVILLAPGHLPSALGSDSEVAAALRIADEMRVAGSGGEQASFVDFNQGKRAAVTTTAEIYLSWFDPNGPANMVSNAFSIDEAIPVLCIDGAKERFKRCSGTVMPNLPENPRTERHEVNADHLGVPDRSADIAGRWLNRL